MFAHPRCPCTRASLNELARLMARAQGGVKGFILFYQPEEFPEDWSRTDLWWTAASIEGVTVLADVNGENASQFGAATSGQVLLYSPSGELRYAGGLTGLRGHEGPNQGSKMLYSLIHDDCGPGVREFPVFGCAILDPEN